MTAALGLPRDVGDGLRAFQAVALALEGVESAAAQGGSAAQVSPRDAAETAFASLRHVLVDLGAPAGFDGRAVDSDPCYVLACYADEALLHHIEWSGRAIWPEMLLERTLYGSRIAGEKVLAMAETVSARISASRDDLAAVLFLALACGFRGKFRGGDDRGAITSLKRGLYEKMMERPPPDALLLREHAGAAYDHTMEARRRRGQSRWRQWTWAPVAAALIWIVIAHGIWWSANHRISALAGSIISTAEDEGGAS